MFMRIVAMSPTPPTYAALYSQLAQAHRRIRELEAREADLVADLGLLRCAPTESLGESPVPQRR